MIDVKNRRTLSAISLFVLSSLATLAGACAAQSVSTLPAREQQLWQQCRAALVQGCEREVHENHFVSVDACLRHDEEEFTGRPSAEARRAYLSGHGCALAPEASTP